RADGRPHVAPIWFDLDGDALVFTTWHTTVKAANLRRDPRVSLCVDDDTPPYAFVLFEGIATLSEDPDELLRWATSIAGRYMGSDQAEAFGRRNGVPGELLVRVTPTHVVAKTKISD
ncbi:MAG: PPOX class F420-dependent oxidoreductase, partial [Roseiflexaceae bacterium]